MRAISPQLLERAYGDPNKKHVFLFVFSLDDMCIDTVVYANTDKQACTIAVKAIAEEQDITLAYARELTEDGASFQLT